MFSAVGRPLLRSGPRLPLGKQCRAEYSRFTPVPRTLAETYRYKDLA
jgi:hypothetical protein